MRAIMSLLSVAIAAPALAQTAPEPHPGIRVIGFGSVSTKPDIANLTYWVAGEGKTADEASAALAAKHKAISNGLSGLLGTGTQVHSGDVSIIETRAPQCDGPNNYNNRARLSEGPCAPTGFVASLQGSVRTRAVDKAATAAGLAARLGARDARVQNFQVEDRKDAIQRATALAIADARAKAEAMAAGAQVRLGPLIRLDDQNAIGTEMFGQSLAMARSTGAPPAPPAPPPVPIDLSPRAIETQARIIAIYSIER